MNRSLKVASAWIAGLLIGVPLLLYGTLLAINWHDQPPSPLVEKLTVQIQSESNIVSDDNGYVDLMGFDVSPGDDPHAMGVKRIAWLEKVNQVGLRKAGDDPIGVGYDFKMKRKEAVKFLSSCADSTLGRPANPKCIAAFKDIAALESWIKSESWLLDRYQVLLSCGEWQDQFFTNPEAPLPFFSTVMEAQKLLLAKAAVLSSQGQLEEVKQLLGSDARFWRRVLSSTNVLITKMIATAALNRHFEISSRILMTVAPVLVGKSIPTEWTQPLSDSERSLRKVMMGEWLFASASLRKTDKMDWDAVDWSDDGRKHEQRWLRRLTPVMYQPQDTINETARRYMDAAEASEVGYQELNASLAKLRTDMESESLAWLHPRSWYNPVGRVLIAMGDSAYLPYAGRVADIEGVRRVTLAAFELRAASVKPDDVPAALKKSPFRNPYSNQPFEWNAVEKTIVFKGLEPWERGVHRVYY